MRRCEQGLLAARTSGWMDLWAPDLDGLALTGIAWLPMADPYWVDERGRRLQKQPCPRCGANVGPLRLRVESLRNLGWRAFQVERYQNWCGHGQEIIPIPQSDGTVLFIPVVGEAS